MKEQLFEIFKSTGQLTLTGIISHIAAATTLGFVIYVSYLITHKGTLYSKKFNATLVMLTVLTGTVMTVIGNNIALSLGMVGALSIVRFRTAIKDSRDTAYIFWAVIVGICCGVGDYTVAFVGSAFCFVVTILIGLIKNDNRVLIIIRGSRSRQSMVQAYIYKMFGKKAVLKVRNTTEENMEMIYEVTSGDLIKVETSSGNIIDSIYNFGGMEYVNVVMQNDEISV